MSFYEAVTAKCLAEEALNASRPPVQKGKFPVADDASYHYKAAKRLLKAAEAENVTKEHEDRLIRLAEKHMEIYNLLTSTPNQPYVYPYNQRTWNTPSPDPWTITYGSETTGLNG